MKSHTALALLLVVAPWAAGCEPQSWAPPAPQGVTWQYNHQGFRERSTNVFAGSMMGPGGGIAYGGAFSFRNDSEIGGKAAKDPFEESAPIDGIRFNAHLGNQGSRLSPSGVTPARPGPSLPVVPVPSSSAPVAPKPAPIVPTGPTAASPAAGGMS